ncbi:hypothetical protein C8F01DRAFT_1370440 [Mycena amicta]|nr:hypothetical protein C8F01DRAFT_1370440 [Mycena amicta]
MMAADSDPFFPPELEQAIFEMAALMFPKKVPELLLVSQRVHFWLEPFLYRHLRFDRRPRFDDSVHRRNWQAASEKPPAFLTRAVRSLALALPSEQDLVQWIYAMLRRCTGLTHLVVNHDGHAPEFLTILGFGLPETSAPLDTHPRCIMVFVKFLHAFDVVAVEN